MSEPKNGDGSSSGPLPPSDAGSADVVPSESQPPLPPRAHGNPLVFSNSPQTLSVPPAYAPNETLPKFIRALALVLFIAGGVSSGIAYIYRNYLYPRLIRTLYARRNLSIASDSLYTQLLNQITALRNSDGAKKILATNRKPKSLELPERPSMDAAGSSNDPETEGNSTEKKKENDTAETKKSSDSSEELNEKDESQEEIKQGLLLDGVCEQINGLTKSLDELTKIRKLTQPPDPIMDDVKEDKAVKLSSLRPEERLLDTLHRVSTMIQVQNTMSLSMSSQFPVSRYGSFVENSLGMDKEQNGRKSTQAARELRNEARNFKGALLNRRSLTGRTG